MFITKDNIDKYLLGSVFLGTGGGLPLEIHKKIFDDILKNKDKINVASLNDFKESDILVSAYGVGDPSIIPSNFNEIAQEGFAKFRKLTGFEIKGIIPGEIGAEGLAFQKGEATGLPVVDSDLVGGRAAPEVQLDVFSVFNLSIAPVLLVSANGKNLFLDDDYSANEIEEISRGFFDKNEGSGILIGYGISAGKYKKYAMQDTLSLAMEIGGFLDNGDVDGLLKKMSGKIVFEGIVKDVKLRSKGGFLFGRIVLDSGTIMVKNENIIFKVKEESIQAPDILMLINEDCTPIHNTNMENYIGEKVELIHAPPPGYWKNSDAKLLWKSII